MRQIFKSGPVTSVISSDHRCYGFACGNTFEKSECQGVKKNIIQVDNMVAKEKVAAKKSEMQKLQTQNEDGLLHTVHRPPHLVSVLMLLIIVNSWAHQLFGNRHNHLGWNMILLRVSAPPPRCSSSPPFISKRERGRGEAVSLPLSFPKLFSRLYYW